VTKRSRSWEASGRQSEVSLARTTGGGDWYWGGLAESLGEGTPIISIPQLLVEKD